MPNPYASSSLPQSRTWKATASFEVGDSERHTVEIFFSTWSGLEIYAVDGVEVLRVRNYRWRSTHRFCVGTREPHQIEIRLDLIPNWRALFDPEQWVAQAYVDGVLVVEDLVPEYRQFMRGLLKTLNFLVFVLLLGAVVAVAAAIAIIGITVLFA